MRQAVGDREHLAMATALDDESRLILRREDQSASGSRARRKRVSLNNTELEFLHTILAEKVKSGELKYVWSQSARIPFPVGEDEYRPDFTGIRPDGRHVYYEVKGDHVSRVSWSRHGVERFKRAREAWPGVEFQMWKRGNGRRFQQVLKNEGTGNNAKANDVRQLGLDNASPQAAGEAGQDC